MFLRRFNRQCSQFTRNCISQVALCCSTWTSPVQASDCSVCSESSVRLSAPVREEDRGQGNEEEMTDVRSTIDIHLLVRQPDGPLR